MCYPFYVDDDGDDVHDPMSAVETRCKSSGRHSVWMHRTTHICANTCTRATMLMRVQSAPCYTRSDGGIEGVKIGYEAQAVCVRALLCRELDDEWSVLCANMSVYISPFKNQNFGSLGN